MASTTKVIFDLNHSAFGSLATTGTWASIWASEMLSLTVPDPELYDYRLIHRFQSLTFVHIQSPKIKCTSGLWLLRSPSSSASTSPTACIRGKKGESAPYALQPSISPSSARPATRPDIWGCKSNAACMKWPIEWRCANSLQITLVRSNLSGRGGQMTLGRTYT